MILVPEKALGGAVRAQGWFQRLTQLESRMGKLQPDGKTPSKTLWLHCVDVDSGEESVNDSNFKSHLASSGGAGMLRGVLPSITYVGNCVIGSSDCMIVLYYSPYRLVTVSLLKMLLLA